MTEVIADNPKKTKPTDKVSVDKNNKHPSQSYTLTPSTGSDPWVLKTASGESFDDFEVEFLGIPKDEDIPSNFKATINITVPDGWSFSGEGYQYCDGSDDPYGDVKSKIKGKGDNELEFTVQFNGKVKDKNRGVATVSFQFVCEHKGKVYHSPDPRLGIGRNP